MPGRYQDGGFHHNNPARVAQQERKLIWGDVAGAHPDLLLSVGTGTMTVEKEDDMRPLSSGRDSLDGSGEGVSSSTPVRPSMWTSLSLNTFVEDVDRFLASRDDWDNFVSEHTAPRFNDNKGSTNGDQRRYIRFNPDLQTSLPRLNDVQALERLERAAALYFNLNSLRIQEVAHRLVASTFFFEKDPNSVQQISDNSTWECQGKSPSPAPPPDTLPT